LRGLIPEYGTPLSAIVGTLDAQAKVVTQIQLGSSRTDSLVRILHEVSASRARCAAAMLLERAEFRQMATHRPASFACRQTTSQRVTYQTVRFGSPDLETATAIQALALALSASRSARHGALSFRPPAAIYCFAIPPRERQFSEVSYL
jgi:hypothetical protein